MKPWEETWSLRRMSTYRGQPDDEEAYGYTASIGTDPLDVGLPSYDQARMYLVGPHTSKGPEAIALHEARARLAAAAPELYRALDELMQAVNAGAVPLRSDVEDAWQAGDAALRKARGE